MAVSVLRLFLMVPWIGLVCVIVVFLDHAHFLLHVKCEAVNGNFAHIEHVRTAKV